MSDAALLAASWADLPWFVLLSLAFFYIPGRALLSLAGVAVAGLDELALALPLGMLGGLLAFWLAAGMDSFALAYAWPVAGGAVALASRRGWGVTLPPRRTVLGLMLLVGLCLVPLWLIPIYVQNAVPMDDGGLSFYPLGDVILHLTLAQDLVYGLPERVPFLPDRAAPYHYGADLLVANLARIGGMAVASVSLRYMPMLAIAMATLAVFCAARAFLGSERGALLTAVLVMLGEDFSFVPGVLVGAPQPWSVHFFGMPSVMPLYHLNPMIYAVAFLFAGLLASLRLARTGAMAWACLAATLFAGASLFKIFVGPHVIASLAIAMLVTRLRVKPLAVLTALTTVLFALVLASGSPDAGRFWVRIDPWPYVPAALVRSGLADLGWAANALRFFAGSGEISGALSFFFLALPLFLVGAMGVAALGWVWVVRSRSWPGEPWVRVWLAVFVCLGPAISLTWAVTPRDYPMHVVYNNAVWFFGQSQLVLKLLAVALLLPLLDAAARSSRLLAGLLVMALSLPSTGEYLAFQVREGKTIRLGSETVAALGWLEQHAAARSVVYAPEPLAVAVASLTPCRSATLQVFPRSLLAPEELAELAREADSFWSGWEAGFADPAPLRRFGARYLLAPVEPQRDAWPEGLELVWRGRELAIFEVSLEPGLERGDRRS